MLGNYISNILSASFFLELSHVNTDVHDGVLGLWDSVESSLFLSFGSLD